MKATFYEHADFHHVEAGQLVVVFSLGDAETILRDDKLGRMKVRRLQMELDLFLVKATTAVSSHLRQQRRAKPRKG